MRGERPPPNHTALAALPATVLDLETTGLDVKHDRVVQIAAIALLGSHILDAPRIDLLVDPEIPIPAVATGVHGIRDQDVAGAPRIAELLGTLRKSLSGRVVIGHHIAFDLAVLRHEAARAGVAWQDPPSLDLAQLVGALEPSLPDLSLESVARLLDIGIERRHSALGDALAAAAAYLRLVPRLRQADVRTLGEAQSFAARRHDLVLTEMQAGWHALPGSAPFARTQPPPTRIDSHVFERKLRDVMSTPPLLVGADSCLRDAAHMMVQRRVGALLVGQPDAPAQGIITERDLLRAAALNELDFDATPVTSIMSSPVHGMLADEMLYRALARMDQGSYRHLCVVDDRAVPVGMVSQRDLLHHRAEAAFSLGNRLSQADTAQGLAAAHGELREVAGRLLAEGLDGLEIARVISNELRALTARAAEIAAARLQASGAGAAPAPWCLLVLGSGGRGESLLAADQDNALVHAGSAADDVWFGKFGVQIADLLDEAGVPRCSGGVMAANKQWRGTLTEWQQRVDVWLNRARPEDLLSVDILFDLAPAAGDASLARIFHEGAVRAASHNAAFIGLLAASVSALRPALGLFGRLKTEQGRVDLKRGALLQLTGIARTIALRVASTACSTPERLQEGVTAGRLSEADASMLADTHAQVLTLVLRQQLADLRDGVPPSSRVATAGFERAALGRLRLQLRRLDEMLRELRGIIAG